MDRGRLYEKAFYVAPALNESFVLEIAGRDFGEITKDRYAFTNIGDLMAFLMDERDAFINRKAPAQ